MKSINEEYKQYNMKILNAKTDNLKNREVLDFKIKIT